MLVRRSDVSFPVTESVLTCSGSRRGLEVGMGWRSGGALPLWGAHYGNPTGGLASRRCREPQRASMEREPGEHHQHPQPNPPALYICARPVSKSRPPLFSLKSPLLLIMHHLFSFLPLLFCSRRKDGFFYWPIVSHRHKTSGCQSSNGSSLRAFHSAHFALWCWLEERGGNSYFSTWNGSRRAHEGQLFT